MLYCFVMIEKYLRGQIVLLGGLPGAGKTTTALGIQKLLGPTATLIEADNVWREVLGKPADQPILGVTGVTPKLRLRWHWRMLKLAYKATKNDGIAIIPAVFKFKYSRRIFEGMATLLHTKHKEFWLVASTATSTERTAQRYANWSSGSPEPNNPSISGPSKLDPFKLEQTIEASWVRINAEQPREVVLQQIYAKLKSPEPEKQHNILRLSHPRDSAQLGLHP